MKILCLDVSDCNGGQEEGSNHRKGKADEHSQKAAEAKRGLPVWTRCGQDITYTQNKYINDTYQTGFFSCSFSFEFGAGSKEMYFAHSMPYTYTMLN